MASFFSFSNDWEGAGDDDRDRSVGLPLTDFWRVNNPDELLFKGAFFDPKLPWFASWGKSDLLTKKSVMTHPTLTIKTGYLCKQQLAAYSWIFSGISKPLSNPPRRQEGTVGYFQGYPSLKMKGIPPSNPPPPKKARGGEIRWALTHNNKFRSSSYTS